MEGMEARIVEKLEDIDMRLSTGYFNFCQSYNNRRTTYFLYAEVERQVTMGLREVVEEENWVMRPMIVQNYQAGKNFVVLMVVVGVVVMIECRSSMAS